jgi:hypothetical protein
MEEHVSQQSVADSRDRVISLRRATVRTLEAAAAWVVTTGDLATKLALAEVIWDLARAADVLGSRLPGLLCPPGPIQYPPAGSPVDVRTVVTTVPSEQLWSGKCCAP